MFTCAFNLKVALCTISVLFRAQSFILWVKASLDEEIPLQ